ncbi:MAG: undecaprenyl/decaprenyl-phosphate alpha-N-acetylglucosaminyl 1-phosphate transferase [Sedimentisphaerales bacterium]|nr:undecaprenyl/decaprenyl-phosphate alpha-N-acetylglucosaminyl 1-phosphate transferase [Sedimentisphaerales bacterium]
MEYSTFKEALVLLLGSTFVTALTMGVILTSWMIRFCRRTGAFDRPDGLLKQHDRPTPTLGGVPLFLAMVAGMLVAIRFAHVMAPLMNGLFVNPLPLIGAGLGALIILCLGVNDDLRRVEPRTKLLFQAVASMCCILAGLTIHRINCFGLAIFDLQALAVPFTLFWLIGSCNAFNFIDGMDGLASGIGFILAAFLGILALAGGFAGPAVIALALAGALLAVLLFNLHPAKIFLGDSGSQLVGLLLGALTIRVATINEAFLLPVAGIMLSIPVIDTFMSVLRRWADRAGVACGDRRHIHHCLQRHGLSVRAASIILWISVLLTGLAALANFYGGGNVMAAASITLVALELYVFIRMGCLEPTRLLQRHRASTTMSVGTAIKTEELPSETVAELEVLWNRMKPHFEQMNLDRAILTLEGITEDGRANREIYQWVRSEELLADLLASRWTRRIPLDRQRFATISLESARQLRRDEERLEWIIRQISENMRVVNVQQKVKKDETSSKTTTSATV